MPPLEALEMKENEVEDCQKFIPVLRGPKSQWKLVL
jgi:hypothetical protein